METCRHHQLQKTQLFQLYVSEYDQDVHIPQMDHRLLKHQVYIFLFLSQACLQVQNNLVSKNNQDHCFPLCPSFQSLYIQATHILLHLKHLNFFQVHLFAFQPILEITLLGFHSYEFHQLNHQLL